MRAAYARETEDVRKVAEIEREPERPEKNIVFVLKCIKCGERIRTIPRSKLMLLKNPPAEACDRCLSLNFR
jgi:ribosomal protein L44E